VAAAAFNMRFDLETVAAQDPQPQEQKRKTEALTDMDKRKLEIGERSGTAREELMKERIARDPQFAAELERRREFEIEMMAVKQAALVKLARINMDQAIQIATSHQSGKVMSATLDARGWEEPGKLAKDGQVFYHVLIADEANGGATHVWINAVDGSLIKSEKELPRKQRSPENQ
jgi:uncharacterized membrane protein YkoI